MSLSDFAIPAVFVVVIIWALIKRVNVFEEFTEGVKEGLGTVLGVFPSLFALIVCVGMFRASGVPQLITDFLAPLLEPLGYPKECLPLAVLRPFSGSGAIAMYEGILSESGADSFAGRVASVMLGSSETTFYTIAVYFAATKVKKTRYALAAAMTGDVAVCILSVVVVGMMF